MQKHCVFLFLSLVVLSFSGFAAQVEIVNLRVEYEDTPMSIDIQRPRFSWQMRAGEPGYLQTAYQLVVLNDVGKEVWNSAKNASEVSLNIEYRGEVLKPATRYRWVVYVWDQNKKRHTAESWFETGVMNSSSKQDSWSGAKWIGGSDDDLVLYAHYLPVFKVGFSLQLNRTESVKRAGFVYGANDNRLMDEFKNLYHLKNAKDQSYIKVELDISKMTGGENAQLNIFRVGYHPSDQKDVPFKSYPIPLSIINNENKYERHSFEISSNLGSTRIWIDGLEKENLIGELNLNPLGNGGDFITFPVLGDIGFSLYKGNKANFSDVHVKNFRSPSNVLFRENTGSLSNKSIFSRQHNIVIADNTYEIGSGSSETFIVSDPSRNATPMLRTTFSSSPLKVTKARLYVTARGVYEVYLNGTRIGEDFFNPGLTQYTKTHLYQTYDVTDHVKTGQNCLGAILAEGWWSGGATYMGQFWNFFGDRQSLLAKLLITYEDGSENVVVTDPSKWSYFNDGPIVYGSFFQGEVYDATKEKLVDGWSTAAFASSNWKPAVEISVDGHVSRDESQARLNMPPVADYTKSTLTGQFGLPVRMLTEVIAKSVEEVRPKVFVYDMGQNLVGIPKIEISGMTPGKKIFLRYAEVKYPDLPEYKDHVGMIMLENIRAAMSQDIYICKGGKETIKPRFTFHGFRFLEITGVNEPLPLTAVKSMVLSSIDKLTSGYECSNPKVNQLWSNITWSTFGNFLSIPTDCPQRNERLGWSGDISVFSRTATYLAHVPQFLRRHMLSMRDVQRADGRFSDVAPLGGGFGGVLWGSAGITVAWESYLQYGDKKLLEEHYGAMKTYIDYVMKKNIDTTTNLLVQENPTSWANLGDWLGPEQERNDNSLLWEAYFIYDIDIMRKVAALLDEKEDQQRFESLYIRRKKFFNETYIDHQTRKTIHSGFKQHKTTDLKSGDLVDTQTSYALPLAFDLIEEVDKDKLVKNFVEAVTGSRNADNGKAYPPYSLMTGFIGTAWINKALSDHGHTKVAYRLLQQTTYPSWLYPVEQGATTVWERLNSYTHTDGFGGNNGMNSFNHYSFGAVGAWLCAYSLGIERDNNSPGFKHFILQPETDATGGISFARGHYDSMYGRIESSWKLTNGSYIYNFIVPANTTATLYLDAKTVDDIKANGEVVRSLRGVKYVGLQKTKQVFELQSGQYEFQVKNR